MSNARPLGPQRPAVPSEPCRPAPSADAPPPHDSSLTPLVIGAVRPADPPPFQPLSGPPRPAEQMQPLPVARQTRWWRMQDETEKRAAHTLAVADRQAQERLDRARREADDLLASRERLTREAIERECAAFREEAARLLGAIDREKETLLQRIEYDVAALTADMAGAIVRRKIQADDQIVLDVVRDALAQVADARRITLAVSPSDLARVGSHIEKLAETLHKAGSITVVARDDVEPGGCLVTAGDATVDATIQAQLERSQAILAAALQPHSPHADTLSRDHPTPPRR